MTTKEWITIASLILATFVGHGGIWKYMQWKIEKKYQKLAEEKHEFLQVAEITRLREKLNNILYRITKLTDEYQKALALKSEASAKFGSLTPEQKIALLNTELDLLSDDFMAIEKKLAGIENREPRKINLYFRPPSITSGIRIVEE